METAPLAVQRASRQQRSPIEIRTDTDQQHPNDISPILQPNEQAGAPTGAPSPNQLAIRKFPKRTLAPARRFIGALMKKYFEGLLLKNCESAIFVRSK